MSQTPAPLDEPASHYFYSQRLRLHYCDWGNPEAPPLIMVHGGRDHCRAWDQIARRLRHRWHVITPDLRGHGDSDWAPGAAYGIPFYMYDLDRLIEATGVTRPVLMAHSLGGNVSVRYTGVYPERIRALIAIEGLGPKTHYERDAWPVEKKFQTWMTHAREIAGWKVKHYASLDDALARMREAHPRYSAELAAYLTRHGMTRHEDGTYTWKYDHYVRAFPPIDIPQTQVRQLWERITCPVLLAGGTESWHTDPVGDGRAAHFRNVQVAMFKDANHWVHHDQPEAFLERVEAFLAKLPAE